MVLPVSKEMAEKGDLTRQSREVGEGRSYQTVKRGQRRVILPASEEMADEGDLTRQ